MDMFKLKSYCFTSLYTNEDQYGKKHMYGFASDISPRIKRFVHVNV